MSGNKVKKLITLADSRSSVHLRESSSRDNWLFRDAICEEFRNNYI